MRPVKPYDHFHAGYKAGRLAMQAGEWDARMCEDVPGMSQAELVWNRGYEQAAADYSTTPQ